MRCIVYVLTFAAISTAYSEQEKSRIIGGDDASLGQFPYVCAIYQRTSSGTYFCSGSLVGPQWILTAATCADNTLQFTIHLGSNSLTEDNPARKTEATEEYIVHPEFDTETFVGDIALIKLRGPVELSDFIKTVFLPIIDSYTDDLIAVGWGSVSDGDDSLNSDLRYVTVRAVDTQSCQQIYGSVVTEDIVCATGNYNEGTCRGDIGSPLIHTILGRSPYVLGVSSFISSRGCESTDPSGYTKVWSYRPWIRNVTAAQNERNYKLIN